MNQFLMSILSQRKLFWVHLLLIILLSQKWEIDLISNFYLPIHICELVLTIPDLNQNNVQNYGFAIESRNEAEKSLYRGNCLLTTAHGVPSLSLAEEALQEFAK